MALRFSGLAFVLLSVLASPVLGHVRLTFPPARTIQDDIDNVYSIGPCGVNRANDSVPTPLVAGADVRVSWHLAYPHKGGFRINLLLPLTVNGTLWVGNGGVPRVNYEVYNLTADDAPGVSFGTSVNDTTVQEATVRIPAGFPACGKCALQLTRIAEDFAEDNNGDNYIFYSCADVRIVAADDSTAADLTGCLGCSGHGTCNTAADTCSCTPSGEKLYNGQYCHNWDECSVDTDCGPAHGRCVDIGSKTGQPNKQCYCQAGWFGPNCATVSALTLSESDDLHGQYADNHVMTGDASFMFFWNITGDEIEVVVQVATDSWVAVGWRPESSDASSEDEDEDEAEDEAEDDEEEDSGHRRRRLLQDGSGYQYEMSSQDMTIASARGNYFRIRDSWSTAEGTPQADTVFGGTDDILDAIGLEANGYTFIKYRRRLVTGDSADWDIVHGTPMYVIYAFGQSPTVFGAPAVISHEIPTGAEDNTTAMAAFYRTDELRYHGYLNRGEFGTLDLLPAPVTTETGNSTGNSTTTSSKTCTPSTLDLDCMVSLRGGNYLLHWTAHANGDLSFAVDVATTGYVSFGFPKNSGRMTGGEAVIGWVQADGTGAHVAAYSLTSTKLSGVVLNANIALNQTSVTRSAGRTLMRFTYPASTLAARRRHLLQDKVTVSTTSFNNIILAYGANGVNRLEDHHSNKGSARINFFAVQTTATNGTIVEEDEGEEINYYKTHGALMIIGWGILLPVGAMIARFGKKWNPLWFHVHRGCQTLGLVITTIAFIIAVNKFDVGILDNKHTNVGLAAMILMWAQPVFGNKLVRPHKGDRFRVEWEYLHIGAGRAGVLLAFVTMFFGFQIYEDDFGSPKDARDCWIAWVSFLAFVYFVLSWLGDRSAAAKEAAATKSNDIELQKQVGMNLHPNASQFPSKDSQDSVQVKTS